MRFSLPTPMMRSSEAGDRDALTAFCGDSLCGAYILCRYLCYGNDYPFARCYVAFSGDMVCTAVSVLEDTAVLLSSEATDFEELQFFLPMAGIRQVMTDAATAQKLPFPVAQERQALRFAEYVDAVQAAETAPMREIYDLISTAIPGSFAQDEEAYLRFLSDFTFRRTRGHARMKAILQSDQVCACALTAAECSAAAVISGVACRAQDRGKGYGKAVVSAITSDLQKEHKTVYVIALHDKAVGFYRRLGFQDAERIVWFTIEE